jgi:TIR domain
VFFGMCIYESLSSIGRLDSIIITPSKESPILVTDWLSDVGPNLAHDVDIGPLRFYTTKGGLEVRTAASRIAPPAFQEVDDTLSFELHHNHWPLRQSHAGKYILLMPAGFGGQVEAHASDSSVVFMEDAHQLLLAATVTPHSPSISIRASLERGAGPPPSATHVKTARDVFRSTFPGLQYYEPVDNLLRAVQADLAAKTSAFLCHSSGDKAQVRRLAIELASRGVRPWLDEAEIRVGDSLIEKIQTGIQSATCLVPILSKGAVTSRWCKEELHMALAMQIQTGIKGVLPVLLEDCEIPGFLMAKAYADLRPSSDYDIVLDRLAANIRDLGRAA